MSIHQKRREMLYPLMLVDTKDNRRIPFVPNKAQRYLEEQIGDSKLVVITKARQLGTTEKILKDFLVDAYTQSPLKVAVVSHEAEATQRLLNRVRMTAENMPAGFPPLHHNSANEMDWPSVGSAFYIGTAGARSFGRGDTFHRVLLSEYGHYIESEALSIMAGLYGSRPPGGVLIAESSPHGEGTPHHKLYVAAKMNESPFKAVFMPWWFCGDYTMERGDQAALESCRWDFTPTEEEQALQREHHLTLEQIRWRRTTIAAQTIPEVFLQEFPEDDVSCFLSFSQTVFSAEAIVKLRAAVKSPVRMDDNGVEWWYPILEGRVYVLGVDPATEYGEDEGVALLLDVTDYPRVIHNATLHGKMRDILFARKLTDLAGPCNGFMVVESNNVGLSVLNSLVNTFNYGNLFYQADPLSGAYKTRPGFLTTQPSKRLLLEEGHSVIDNGYLLTHDKNLVIQLQYFRQYGESFRAAPGQHDDYPMALMLGLIGAKVAPRIAYKGRRSISIGPEM